MPDYYVPPNRSPKDDHGLAESVDVRCPRCGSAKLFPTSGLETRMKMYQCGQCGLRYRVRPHLPTWNETLRDPVVIFGMIIVIVVVVMLFL